MAQIRVAVRHRSELQEWAGVQPPNPIIGVRAADSHICRIVILLVQLRRT